MYRYIFIKYNIIEIDTEGMEDIDLRHIALLRDENYIDIDSQVHDYFNCYLPSEELSGFEPCDYYSWFSETYIVDILHIEGITVEQYELLSRLQILGPPVTQPMEGM